ncbi:hypothetical protein [Oscillatoria acuminata]|nr:hypothetical protein [Oscillatoria acuminata]
MFEEEVVQYCNGQQAIALNSGTDAPVGSTSVWLLISPDWAIG